MEKHKAIPQGYMTVGEVAKKTKTTVRTLQYYDKEGVLAPSAESEGGRRLYTDTDIIKLHQILSMKYLGFSLDDIKNRLTFLDTPVDVATMLTEHAADMREKITALEEALHAIEALKKEVLAMQSVDFKKYADIILNLQIKNDFYWIIKHFDNQTLDDIRNRFGIDRAAEFIKTMNHLWDKAAQFQIDSIQPESDEAQEFAKDFWDKIIEFSGGDMGIIPKLTELVESLNDNDNEWKKKQDTADDFIGPALKVYFSKSGFNPEGCSND